MLFGCQSKFRYNYNFVTFTSVLASYTVNLFFITLAKAKFELMIILLLLTYGSN